MNGSDADVGASGYEMSADAGDIDELNVDAGLSVDGSVERETQNMPDSSTALSDDEVVLTTRLGEIVIKVNFDLAPASSRNLLHYVDDGFYDGQDGAGVTVFHRVMTGFMIQGGGLLDTGDRKQTRAAIVNESMNGLQNLRGTVAMSRTSDPNSATSQFFINHYRQSIPRLCAR